VNNICIYSDAFALIEAAAAAFIKTATESIYRRGVFNVAFSGGSTPKPLYAALGSPAYARGLAWNRVHLFWGDERYVPPEHPDSNYRMVKEGLLSRIAMPKENIHRVLTELEIQMAADQYERMLRRYFNNLELRFDLILLGMGDDGHTASLFPQSSALNERRSAGSFPITPQ